MSMWFSPLCLLVVFIKVKLPHRQRLGERGSFFLMNAPDFPCGSAGKESACSEGDLASIPGLGRSPVRGKGYTPQYFGLENSKDCIVHGGVTNSQTWLSSFHFHFSKGWLPGPWEKQSCDVEDLHLKGEENLQFQVFLRKQRKVTCSQEKGSLHKLWGALWTPQSMPTTSNQSKPKTFPSFPLTKLSHCPVYLSVSAKHK